MPWAKFKGNIKLMKRAENRRVVFFDGVCNLCTWSIDFIHARDTKKQFYFASLQGETAKAILSDVDRKSLGSVILISEGKLYRKSGAGIRILAMLKWYYKPIWIFWFIPYFIRDFLYNSLAKSRYRIFGKRESCRFPTEEEKAYFLS